MICNLVFSVPMGDFNKHLVECGWLTKLTHYIFYVHTYICVIFLYVLHIPTCITVMLYFKTNHENIRTVIYGWMQKYSARSCLNFGHKVETMLLNVFSEALETTPTRNLRIRKAWAAHTKMFWYCLLSKKHSRSLLNIIWQSVNTQKFEFKKKWRTATSTHVTT
jgi:hypothetical protein